MAKIFKDLDKRSIFIDTLIELAEKDDKIILITPDVGFNKIEKFRDKFPLRFINTGITEEFTVIMAAALALDGWKPYVYSMVNFVAFRPFEMVRNAIHFHGANVKLLGVKGSAAYKMLGFSHNMKWEEEDTYILNNYVDCYVPEEDEVERVIRGTYDNNKAAYIRL